eukprot:CAMPEP_0170555632 /NCGR_PEP_ID=MMETSP0211-20121228/13510_1 /TAXON_ID=311385 /ORGANISM="Pseudokeronopsis sp., Strain OXSARD2" /LENGTH=279 /DNA_ID=CAMNT_0010865583 /DNA_START=3167 /DNA_END=4003 /DNA_ORIENTATION=+
MTFTESKMVNFDRMFQVSNIPQEQIVGINIRKDWPRSGKIEFENVGLSYRPNTEAVLKELNFQVKDGEKVGVVGRTGAGKSTVCLSMSRILELVEGRIKVDGQDISHVNLNFLRHKITVIPQDPTMFKDTLRYNLDPEGNRTKDELVQLLNKAGLEGLLERDGNGLEFSVSENGNNLSSGEKQLICICRAILRKNKVVILDEATSNIDIVTEQKIQQLIQEEFKDSTVITIAHRINTIIKSDRVLVLSYGEMAEYDDPQVLLRNPNSFFSELISELKHE